VEKAFPGKPGLAVYSTVLEAAAANLSDFQLQARRHPPKAMDFDETRKAQEWAAAQMHRDGTDLSSMGGVQETGKPIVLEKRSANNRNCCQILRFKPS